MTLKYALRDGATYVRIGTSFLNRERTMSLKDKFNNFIDYFTEDGEEVESSRGKSSWAETQPVPQPQPTPQVTSPRPQISQKRTSKTKTDSCRTCYDSSVYSGSEGTCSNNEKYI